MGKAFESIKAGLEEAIAHASRRPAAQSTIDIENIWLDEAERRDAEMQSGRVVGLEGDEVFRRIRARYGK